MLAVEMMPRYDQYILVREEAPTRNRSSVVAGARAVPDSAHVAAGRNAGGLLRELLNN